MELDMHVFGYLPGSGSCDVSKNRVCPYPGRVLPGSGWKLCGPAYPVQVLLKPVLEPVLENLFGEEDASIPLTKKQRIDLKLYGAWWSRI